LKLEFREGIYFSVEFFSQFIRLIKQIGHIFEAGLKSAKSGAEKLLRQKKLSSKILYGQKLFRS